MKKIHLDGGFVVLLDDEDFHEMSKFHWRAHQSRNTFYAERDMWDGHKFRVVKMHRVLLGATRRQQVDHRDRNGLNNTRANLRLATQSQNLQNSKRYRSNTTGFKGVCFFKPMGKFQSRITVNGVRKCLGYFDSAVEAGAAYQEAALQYHGEFARFE